ncbi:MAG: histone deacetylase [Phycisphaerae bacterium]|nr:histone deacetylase [Phycisphaerae bacterium]
MSKRNILPRLKPLRLLLVSLVFVGVWVGFCCVVPSSMRQVKAPRRGRAYNDRVAIVYSKHYQMSLGGLEKLHSFDIRKYARIYLKLNTEGLLRPEDVFVPEAVSKNEILLVHTPEFLESLKDSPTVARYLEAPFAATVPNALVDAAILNAFRYSTGGTVLAGRLALKHGIAINIGGGYHHAKPIAGEGFCIYADMPIAIRVLQKEKLIGRAMVIDLDVHQGNGTAVCFATDDSVFTFSMHQGNIYPIPKAVSDLDIELKTGTNDEEFLSILDKNLGSAIDRADPDIVFLQAGCDTLKGDPLANLNMSLEGIVKRDAMVIDECVKRRIPIVMVLGGGYSKRAWKVQYASIARTLKKYGITANRHPHKRRELTGKEKLYTK